MIETREKIIEGNTYMVTQLPARRAIKLKVKLMKLFGPVLAQLFLTINDADEFESKKNLVKAVEILSEHIEENTFEALVLELLNGVRKNNVELTSHVIDLEFAGNMGELYQVLWFVVEVNFSNFFSLMGIGNQFIAETQVKQTTESKRTFTRKS
jgi:hypothetical protein